MTVDSSDCAKPEEPFWFCLKAQPKREHLVASGLRKQFGIVCFAPRLRLRKLTRRGPVWFVEAMWGRRWLPLGFLLPLANPTLYLFDHTGALIAANDNWKDTQQAQIQATGLAPPNNLDAAILITLSPGAYTVFLQGKAVATGIGLAEVYDVDPSANAQPTNLSARAFVRTGNDVLIGRTIIRGNGTGLLRVVVHALGPSLPAPE
jgi:hypothetical protein